MPIVKCPNCTTEAYYAGSLGSRQCRTCSKTFDLGAALRTNRFHDDDDAVHPDFSLLSNGCDPGPYGDHGDLSGGGGEFGGGGASGDF